MSKSRSTSAARREELRRNLPKPTASLRALVRRPEFVKAGLVLVAFIAFASAIVIWSRTQPRVAIDQIMTRSRVNRVDYSIINEEGTEKRQEEARQASPRVYRLAEDYLDGLEHALNALPRAVEGKTSLDQISPELVAEYGLTEEGLAQLQIYSVEGQTRGDWQSLVNRLVDERLRRIPVLESAEYQLYSKTLNRVLLQDGGAVDKIDASVNAIELNENAAERFDDMVRGVGFDANVAQFVTARLGWKPKSTFEFDSDMTDTLEDSAAANAEPATTEYKRGELIYTRGDQLTLPQYEQLLAEMKAYAAASSSLTIWWPRVGLIGLLAILTIFGATFVANSYPRVVRNTARVGAICVLLAAMLGLTVLLTAQVPALVFPVAITATLIVAIIVLLAYDQRMALFIATLQCTLLTLAMGQGIGWFILLMAGCGTMIAQLREVRNRNSLIRAAIITAAALGMGTLLVGLVTMPSAPGLWWYLIAQASWAVAASIVVGFLMLGILPSIERMFDITTGMTLAELRDPSQALLRQLQQRAPGTYNHSLQVANIAEAAADSIGADGLLVYVGALYHDIGKMNKPEYFIENQAGGVNKHRKLRPAMSLLVIIGHVKDGIELAREYGLPRSLQHFIEAHHGTTLVEYFYHAAKEQAEADRSSVNEVEFRYPGPKPRTKEAAILMLADAVESATRAMTEPNPSRIESLVRALSRKRLLDGQFNDCDLTFRELGLIEEAMIARLNAIHHGRISYPSSQKADDAEPAQQKSTA